MEQKGKAARSDGGMRRNYPHEDRALKAAGQMLGEALVALTDLGIKVRRMIPTEQVVLHTEEFMEDFNYETDTDEIAHLEFESDEITKEDLMRFRGYEAVLSYQQQKDVFTCVLCTANAKVLLDEIQTGMNVYRVKVVRLKDWNADEVLHALETKQGYAQPLNKEELLKLILLPLMSGHMKQKERIVRGFHVLHSEREYQEKAELQRMEGVLYILAEKFLNKTDLEELKEEIKVTRLGQMLFDDGWNEGMAQGISQGMAQGISQGMAQGISQGMAKGMAQGISQGITTGMADMILGFLTDLGAVPQRVTDIIRSTKDENKLRTWGKIAGRAESMEEFCEKTGIGNDM